MRKSNDGGSQAFTLIELLIVVLIIAILAAIAVPNFLEFQVRAKISRIKSDMRSLSIGIEAYTVDNGRPPIDGNTGAGLGLWTAQTRDAALYQITTPIAYITTVPQDPFLDKASTTNSGGGILFEESFNFHCYFDNNKNGKRKAAYEEGFTWSMYSVGPSRTKSSPWLSDMVQKNNPNNIYDPTNGTVSRGYIDYCNKGFLTADNAS